MEVSVLEGLFLGGPWGFVVAPIGLILVISCVMRVVDQCNVGLESRQAVDAAAGSR